MDKYTYRVVSKREGRRTKYKTFATIKAAERRLALLTSAEPWKLKDPRNNIDEVVCCDGYECGCGGETHGEAFEAFKKETATLLDAYIEKRPVGDWQPLTQH